MFRFIHINLAYIIVFALNVLGGESADEVETTIQSESIFEGKSVAEAINYDIYDENNQCKEIKHKERNFTSPMRRISEVKCLEYVWRTIVEENEVTLKTDCSPRITVGGRPAFQGEFPHMGAVGWRSAFSEDEPKWVFKCGASLISEKFMLTAAHCSYISSRDASVARRQPEVVKMGDKYLVQTNFTITYVSHLKQHDALKYILRKGMSPFVPENYSNLCPEKACHHVDFKGFT